MRCGLQQSAKHRPRRRGGTLRRLLLQLQLQLAHRFARLTAVLAIPSRRVLDLLTEVRFHLSPGVLLAAKFVASVLELGRLRVQLFGLRTWREGRMREVSKRALHLHADRAVTVKIVPNASHG